MMGRERQQQRDANVSKKAWEGSVVKVEHDGVFKETFPSDAIRVDDCSP